MCCRCRRGPEAGRFERWSLDRRGNRRD
jgi:hypothetical protein